jgi:RNA polymerase sigma-54 factor
MSSPGLQQVQKQTQSLVLAPQLRNSLKILQAPAVELRDSILEELQANPLLEELPIDMISVEDQQDDGSGGDDRDASEELEFNADDMSVLERMSEDLRDYYHEESFGQPFTSEDEERRKHFFDSLTETRSLQQHLIEQAELSAATREEKEALHYLIGSIDERGFLTSSLSDIALMAKMPFGVVQRASAILKTFDPPGIGAADMRDCLLSQLKFKGRETSLAARVLEDHYPLLLRRRIPELARKTGARPDEIQAAIEEIATLDPAPGKRFSEDHNRVVEPDVTVEQDETGEWRITLNNDYIPRLRISSAYKEMLAKGRLTKDERQYIREHMRSGRFLINSIEQRQQTIERITREILDCQKDFFEHGVAKLRPLTMNTLAQAIGVHETTVSRAIANKYIKTPFGVFELKYFFTPGYKSAGGESVSNKSIKEMIAQMVEEEDPTKPFSDQAIVNLLKKREIRIARRTIAKYREELGILPTNLRRRYA